MRAANLFSGLILAGLALTCVDCAYLFPSCATVPGCPNGQVLCTNLACSDLTTDPFNCGFCNNACSSGFCVPTGEPSDGGHGGTCGCPIPTQTMVDGLCVDLQVDPDNCGTVGHKCRLDQACLSGTCGCVSTTYLDGGSAECPTDAGPICTDLLNDPSNCGVCGRVCDGDCTSAACDVSPSDGGLDDGGLDDAGPSDAGSLSDAGDGGPEEPDGGPDAGVDAGADGGDGG